jgi:hypothetical protein
MTDDENDVGSPDCRSGQHDLCDGELCECRCHDLDLGIIAPPSHIRSVLWRAWQNIRHPLTSTDRSPGLCPNGCGNAETYCPGCTSLQCLTCRPCECGEAYGRLGP